MADEARTFQPDWTIPPGATLEEWLEEVSMSQADLAERLNMSSKAVNQIVRGHAAISQATALKLESVTDVPAGIWNRLEANYQEDVARITRIQRFSIETDWLGQLPVTELRKRGLVTAPNREKGVLVAQLLAFFGVADVHAWRNVWEAPQATYRKSPTFQSNPGDLAAWLRWGELVAAGVPTGPYSRESLDTAVAKIRELVTEPFEIVWPQVQAHAAQAGVALVAVGNLGQTRASGATRWVGHRPIVQLSGRHKSDDHIWFSLFHEFGHVRLHSSKATFVDDGGNGDEFEREADMFAANVLIPPEWSAQLSEVGTSAAAVTAFAAEVGVSPGVLVGRLQHEGHVPRSHLNKLKRKIQIEQLSPQ